MSPTEAIAYQAEACARAGSPLYTAVLHATLEDMAAGGPCARLLADRVDDPLGSALPLRFLGALHRIVLEGRAPDLAAAYPSAGGDPAVGNVPARFLAAVAAHEAELAERISEPVQTNEVGRCMALVGGFVSVARRTGLPLRVLELGASAGLNLRFDRYAYRTPHTATGDLDSPLCFGGPWAPAPDLSGPLEVAERRGCDRHPIDATTEDGRLALRSYVWPDQVDRHERLRLALELASSTPVTIDRADAATWIAEQLAEPRPGVATVVFHSIVMQYLPPARRERVHALLHDAGRRATPDAPLAWLSMEPETDEHAAIRLVRWPGGAEERLAEVGYHGAPVRWLRPDT